jgi:hypothetical protein
VMFRVGLLLEVFWLMIEKKERVQLRGGWAALNMRSGTAAKGE